MIIMSTV